MVTVTMTFSASTSGCFLLSDQLLRILGELSVILFCRGQVARLQVLAERLEIASNRVQRARGGHRGGRRLADRAVPLQQFL